MRRKQRRHHCDLPLAERACGRRHVSPSSQGSSLSEDGERTLLLCGVSLGRSTESKPLSLSLLLLLLLLPLHSEAPSFEIRYLASLSLSIRNSAQLHSATSPNERIDSMSFGFHLHSLIMSEHANDYPSVDAPDAVSCDVDGAFHHSRREREGERREE